MENQENLQALQPQDIQEFVNPTISIHKTEDGEIKLHADNTVSVIEILGLLEVAKHIITSKNFS